MSTEDRLRELVAQGTLRYVMPQRGHSAVRYVYLLDALYRRIEHEVEADGEDAERFAGVMAVLYAFIHGKRMTFGMDPISKGRAALIARTKPVRMGIIDFRVMDPSPGMRLMGGFVSADHFVGLRCFGRGEMGPLGGFGGCVRETCATWAKTFGTGLSPVVSDTLREYVTENVHEV